MLASARCRARLLQSLPPLRPSHGGTLHSHAGVVAIRQSFTSISRTGHGLSQDRGLARHGRVLVANSVARDVVTRAFRSSAWRGVQQQGKSGVEQDGSTTALAAKPKAAPTTRENIYNIPNLLTASRLLAAPAIGYLIVRGELPWALGLFFYASVTDLVDGWMARKFHLQTVVGSVIDPMADKLLMTVVTVSLAVKGLLPAYLATLILGRDVALAVAAIYYRYASLPAPKTFRRYWDFSLPSAEVRPTTVSKYNTFLQLVLIGATLALPVAIAEPAVATYLPAPADVSSALTGFGWLVAGTTAWSGLSYAVLKDAVRIIGDDEVKKAAQGRTGRRIIGVLFGGIVAVSAYLAAVEDGLQ